MASVYRTTYTTADGKKKKSSKLTVKYGDHSGAFRWIPDFTDKWLSEELGRKLEKLAQFVAMSQPPDVEISGWLQTIDGDLKSKLAKWGMLDPRSMAEAKPLSTHLDDFRQALSDSGNTLAHASTVSNRARTIVEQCQFKFFSDMAPSAVQRYLASRRAGEGKEPRISQQTSNHYLTAIKQFCRWMVRDRRANENPLTHLQGVTITDTDDRREWTDEELRAVGEAARSGIAKLGMSGEQRAMLYLSAFYTGLRAKELASLTPSHFDLSAIPATVTIEKADEKSRRGKSLPLHPDYAAMIQSWMSGKPTDQLLWPGGWARNRYGNKMVQFDQENAGVEYRTDEGRADFHALRHTFLSRLGRSGASTRVMMDLGRHTTPQMTIRYTHANLYDLAGAIEAVPGVRLAAQKMS